MDVVPRDEASPAERLVIVAEAVAQSRCVNRKLPDDRSEHR